MIRLTVKESFEECLARVNAVQAEARLLRAVPMGTLLSNFLSNSAYAGAFRGLSPPEVIQTLLKLSPKDAQCVGKAIRTARRNQTDNFISFETLLYKLRW